MQELSDEEKFVLSRGLAPILAKIQRGLEDVIEKAELPIYSGTQVVPILVLAFQHECGRVVGPTTMSRMPKKDAAKLVAMALEELITVGDTWSVDDDGDAINCERS